MFGFPIRQNTMLFAFLFSLCCLSARTIHDVRVCSQLHFTLRIRDFMKRIIASFFFSFFLLFFSIFLFFFFRFSFFFLSTFLLKKIGAFWI